MKQANTFAARRAKYIERFQAELLAVHKHPSQSYAESLHDQLTDLRDTLEALQAMLLANNQNGEVTIPESHLYGFLNLLKSQVNTSVAFASLVASVEFASSVANATTEGTV